MTYNTIIICMQNINILQFKNNRKTFKMIPCVHNIIGIYLFVLLWWKILLKKTVFVVVSIHIGMLCWSFKLIYQHLPKVIFCIFSPELLSAQYNCVENSLVQNKSELSVVKSDTVVWTLLNRCLSSPEKIFNIINQTHSIYLVLFCLCCHF